MKLIDKKKVLELTTLSDTTLYRYVKAGKFPRPKKLDTRTIRWIEQDVIDWMQNLPEKD